MEAQPEKVLARHKPPDSDAAQINQTCRLYVVYELEPGFFVKDKTAA